MPFDGRAAKGLTGLVLEKGDLQGRKVLVLEDELLVAMGLEDMLHDFGCEVVGPYATVGEASARADEGGFDIAVLDVNLRGEFSFRLADVLLAEGVPMVMCSGYAEIAVIPDRFAAVPRLSKPYSDEALRSALLQALLAPAEGTGRPRGPQLG